MLRHKHGAALSRLLVNVQMKTRNDTSRSPVKITVDVAFAGYPLHQCVHLFPILLEKPVSKHSAFLTKSANIIQIVFLTKISRDEHA